MSTPLEGIRVLDLSRVLAGPWCTQLLADLGAEVWKIERPGEGDDTRAWGPPYAHAGATQGDAGQARESAYFLSANRGKQSLAVDLAHPEGARIVAQLAARCDVFIENFKVGGLARYGLDYAALSATHPALVYCSITGFGQDGPYAARAGYDFVIQGMSGLMSVTGEPAGEPMKAGVAITDVFTGLYAANAIQAALRMRDRTGRGTHIDLALLDVQVAAMANQALNALVSGRNPDRHGNAHPNIVPYQSFRTADLPITVAVGNDQQFRRLCEVLGTPGLGVDARFASNELRVRNRAALLPLLQELLAVDSAANWLARLEAAGVPSGPVNTLQQVFADPQVRHRGLQQQLPHARVGNVPGVRCPIRMTGADVGSPLAPPALGADTQQVLARVLGLSAAQLEALARAGVVAP
jgi:crotonobetainyl-CoA:carnitine CoA-transferase CaiB-like acyl-CoA transferase